jgi:rsbT co-antagonist protein RsbR
VNERVTIKNLRERLDRLEDVLASAAAMKLDVRVPVTEDDELASTEEAINVLLEDFAALLAERRQAELELQEKLQTIQRQQDAINELSTPVIKVWDGLLVLPIIGTLDSQRTLRMMELLLEQIVATGSRIAILDITGVPVVDTMVANHLIKTVTAAGLMGAECILSGISPTIAQTIVHLGIDLTGIRTKSSQKQSALRSPPPMNEPSISSKIPIIKLGHYLLVPIQVDMTDYMVADLQTSVLAAIDRTGAKGVLIDISVLEMFDSFIGRTLSDIARMAAVMDAAVVIVGMQPAVAITLVELGLEMTGIDYALNIERGMTLLNQRLRETDT